MGRTLGLLPLKWWGIHFHKLMCWMCKGFLLFYLTQCLINIFVRTQNLNQHQSVSPNTVRSLIPPSNAQFLLPPLDPVLHRSVLPIATRFLLPSLGFTFNRSVSPFPSQLHCSVPCTTSWFHLQPFGLAFHHYYFMLSLLLSVIHFLSCIYIDPGLHLFIIFNTYLNIHISYSCSLFFFFLPSIMMSHLVAFFSRVWV